MKKISKKDSLTAKLLVLLVVIIIVVGVLAVILRHHHKSSNITKVSTVALNKTDPYKGWKQYCDVADHYCLQYPPTWKLQSMGTLTQAIVTIEDPGKTVQVSYDNPYSGGNIPASSFYVKQANTLKLDPSLAIVSGYWNSLSNKKVQPLYEIVDTSFLQSYSIKVGKVYSLSSLRFTDDGSASNTGMLTLGAVANNGQLASNQINSWLSANSTQAGVLVLESIKAK
jgi:hypothetical protein